MITSKETFTSANVDHDKLKTGAETYSNAIADAENYHKWILSQFESYLHGNIIEIGIGHGSYFSALRHYGRYTGIDIDEDAVRDASKRFPDAFFAACDICDITRFQALAPNGADAVVCINVLEHIEDDAKAISNLTRILKPGGHLLISVPAISMLYNELDRLAGHWRRYSKTRLRLLLQSEDIDIVYLAYFNSIGGLGWWANSFKHHHSLNADSVNRQIRLFDRYILPVSRMLDPLCRSFFGQSVTCIARRR